MTLQIVFTCIYRIDQVRSTIITIDEEDDISYDGDDDSYYYPLDFSKGTLLT